MIKYRFVAIIYALALLTLSSCDFLPQQKYMPTNIRAMPSASAAGMMWGGDKAKITAFINSVVIECIPIEKSKDDSLKIKRSANVEYEIAATADIAYHISDKAFFKQITMFSDLEANVVFDALTLTGVVIGQSKTTVKLIENGSTAKASAKIVGLTLEEIKRVVKVEARWEYGRK